MSGYPIFFGYVNPEHFEAPVHTDLEIFPTVTQKKKSGGSTTVWRQAVWRLTPQGRQQYANASGVRLGFELATDGIQFYVFANKDKSDGEIT